MQPPSRTQEIATSALKDPSLGLLRTRRQLVPFQTSMKATSGTWSGSGVETPTAMQNDTLVQETPITSANVDPTGLAILSSRHVLPCPPWNDEPLAAMQNREFTQDSQPTPPPLGTLVADHLSPFHISGLGKAGTMQNDRLTHEAVPANPVMRAGLTRRQALPLQD